MQFRALALPAGLYWFEPQDGDVTGALAIDLLIGMSVAMLARGVVFGVRSGLSAGLVLCAGLVAEAAAFWHRYLPAARAETARG